MQGTVGLKIMDPFKDPDKSILQNIIGVFVGNHNFPYMPIQPLLVQVKKFLKSFITKLAVF